MLAIMPTDNDRPLATTRPAAQLAVDVKDALTRAALPPALGQPSPPPRNKERENDQFAKAAKRFARGLARRAVEQQDPEALAMLLEVAQYIEQTLAPAAVEGLRSEAGGSHSWGELGAALGTTRQAAQLRYGKAANANGKAARKPGAQPADRR